MANKHILDMEKMRKIHEQGLHIRKGESNSRWNGGVRIKGMHPCPQCGKDRVCEKRDAHRICFDCHKSRGKKFVHKEWAAQARVFIKLGAMLYKGGKCEHCGADDLPMCCYHFHHIGKKDFLIGRKLYQRISKELMDELDKCILLCANCHAIQHYNERQDLKRAKEKALNTATSLAVVQGHSYS